MKTWTVHNTLESGFFRISPQLGHPRGFILEKDARLAAKAPEMKAELIKLQEVLREVCPIRCEKPHKNNLKCPACPFWRHRQKINKILRKTK